MDLSISSNRQISTPNHKFLFGDTTKAGIEKGREKIDNQACSVSISREGLYKLKNSSSHHSVNIEKMQQYKEVLSKAQIDVVGTIESDFHHRYTRLNNEKVSDELEYAAKAEGFAKNLISIYANMYDEIKNGYAEGTREIYIPDADAEFGYRRATEEEEIAALDAAFDFHVLYTDAYLKFVREDKDIMQLGIQRTHEKWQAAREHRDTRTIDEEYLRRLEKLREKIENTKQINFIQIMSSSRDVFKEQYGVNNNSDLLNGLFEKIHIQVGV